MCGPSVWAIVASSVAVRWKNDVLVGADWHNYQRRKKGKTQYETIDCTLFYIFTPYAHRMYSGASE